MAQWHHLFGLLCVVCISFGALFLVFNSDFGNVCDYSEVVDSCSELKTYIADMVEDNKSFAHEWKVTAQEHRNQSEVAKCDIEKALLEDLQQRERTEAERIVNKCMTEFKACVASGYTTTTPPPSSFDCTTCHRFCDSTKWTTVSPTYATLVGGAGYDGSCGKSVCPWKPECGPAANFFFPNPSSGQCDLCPCQALVCPTTTSSTTAGTTTTTSTTTSTPMTTSTTTTTPMTTTTTTTTAKLTTTTTTTTGKLTSTTTVTTTTSTSTTEKLTTTTSVTTSTSTTSTAAPTTTTTSTSTTTTTGGETTTTTTPACICPQGFAGTVIVGRPMSVFRNEPSWDYNTMKYYQGVNVDSTSALAIGMQETVSCRDYFSQKSKYWGLQGNFHATNAALTNAIANHPDLGCGYSGTFGITCKLGNSSTNCSLMVDVSTCTPPTYKHALADCLTVTTTTTAFTGVTLPTVPDWLTIEDENFTLATLPQEFQITTMTTTGTSCCEVHVGSVCDPNINFNSTWYIGPTMDGRWQPNLSYTRATGYFPTAPCSYQAQSQPRPCPRVKIKELSNAGSVYAQWPSCKSFCANMQQEFAQICNRTKHPVITQKELDAHQQKIDSMKAQKSSLESWTRGRMRTVTASTRVIDCIGDTLPRRYNGMGLPSFRSGYDQLPLHNQCRLHSCKHDQCLKVTQPCKIPWVQTAPEENCQQHKYMPSFECVAKAGISSNDPMSIGFGAAWITIGCIFFCAGAAAYIRQYSKEQDAAAGRVGPRPPQVTETAVTKFGA